MTVVGRYKGYPPGTYSLGIATHPFLHSFSTEHKNHSTNSNPAINVSKQASFQLTQKMANETTQGNVLPPMSNSTPFLAFLASLPEVQLNELPSNAQSCDICMESFHNQGQETAERPVKLPCNHVLGSVCVETWFRSHNSCPLCRATFFEMDPEGMNGRIADARNITRMLDVLAHDSSANMARLNQLLAGPRTLESGAEYARILEEFMEIDGRLDEVEGRVRVHRANR